MKKLVSILSVLSIICLIISGVSVSAVTKVDFDKEVSLSVKYEYNGAPISSVCFDVYKVANLNRDGMFTATEAFSEYSVSFDSLNSDKLKSLSDTLQGYVMRDGIKPVSSCVTDETGFAAFGFSEKQTAGLYLIIGEKKQVGDVIYTPETLMISVPMYSESEGENLYQVVALPKCEADKSDSNVTVEVNKIWKNDSGINRPTSVTVQLIKDGKIFDEVKLDKSNNWRHKWTRLDAKCTWTIAEKSVPSGYLVSITHSGKNYIVVNTFDETTTTNPSDTTNQNGTTNPSGMTKPNGTTTDQATVTSRDDSGSVPSGDTTKPSNKIPQTGMLEWPIPFMYEFGVAFLVIGIVFCVKKRMKMKSKKGIAFISVGLALIIGAISLTAYNKYDEKIAGENAQSVLAEIDEELKDKAVDLDPAYKIENELEMPIKVIDGYEYIGKIHFPSLDLTLPVISESGNKQLKKAPCRYKGSVYTDDMIIGGHNYITHFGRIDNLRYGDAVEFTDIDNNTFEYTVIGTETINGNDGDILESGEWDLSLFTCNMSGRARITVRCVKK